MNDKTLAEESEPPRYWFPAKSYGWGWGFPSTWEGWLVLSLFLAVCCCSTWLAAGSVLKAVGLIWIAAIVLIAIAFWKGEPPRWRWGK